MLDPEYKRHVAEGCERIGSLLHEEIIKIIAEGIVTRIERGVDYRLTARDKWMLETLQAAGYMREDLEKEIAAKTKLMLTEIRDAFQDAAVRNMDWDDAVYAAAGLEPPPLRQSPYLLRLAQRGYEKTCGEWINFTGTLADAAQQLYIRECDRAYTLAASGAMSQTQAVRQAVETAAREGVTVKYTRQREDGTRYVYHTDTIETAVTRAVRTGIGQACGEMSLARMEEMDWDIILVSAHLGARTGDGGDNFTNHFWLQGKFYSRDGSDRRFPPFSVCNVGHVQGLLGANCRHSISPGDGRFNPNEGLYDSEANRIRYEQEQKQRKLERDIRKTKREVQGLKTAMDAAKDPADKAEMKAAYQKKALKLRDQNRGYKAYCEETGLKTQDERLHVAGWDRKQAASAAGAARSAAKAAELTASQKTAIIDKKVQPEEKPDVHTVGHINREIYKCVTEDIQTDEVIITDVQIAHIKERHPSSYERLIESVPSILADPDFIIEANKANTAVLLKELSHSKEKVKLILRLKGKDDPKEYKNSVISCWMIGDTTWRKNIKNKKILYRKE